MKRVWKRVFLTLLVLFLLCACGEENAMEAAKPQNSIVQGTVSETTPPEKSDAGEPATEEGAQQQTASEETAPDAVTSATPENTPEPVEPEETVVTDETSICTISISCATILDNMESLEAEKADLVPEDGWILAPVEVEFNEGESVFDVLQKTCRQEKIHLEYVDTPGYNSAYIEGIYNLYEFDCGNLSGWTYSVNDWFPNYGSSQYQVQSGDVICWEYTRDLGEDVKQS